MDQLTVDIGTGYEHIKTLYIEEAVNNYATAELLVDLSREDAERAQEAIGSSTKIAINYERNGVSHLLFHGNVSRLSVEHDGASRMELKLVSAFHAMDLAERSRSFQDQALACEDLLHRLAAEAYKIGIEVWEGGTQQTGGLLIQYEETDWQFLKRLCALWKLPVFEQMNSADGVLHVGIPKRQLKNVKPGWGVWHGKVGSGGAGEPELTGVIRFSDRECYQLGDTLQIGQRSYVICRKVTRLTGEEIIFDYEGTVRNEVFTVPFDNERITGAGIGGTVIKTKGSRVKVHLDVDEEQKEETAWWFRVELPYTAGNGAGFYFPSKEGERVEVYFPEAKERMACVRGFFHGEADTNDKLSDPSVKYIGTKEQTYTKFDSGSILISGAEGISIELSDDTGISLSSTGKLNIHSDKSVTLSAESLSLEGADQLQLSTGTSSIIIDETTHLYGMNGVWENGQPSKQRI